MAALFAIAMVWLGLGHRPLQIGVGTPAVPLMLAAAVDDAAIAFCTALPGEAPPIEAHAGRCDACVLAVAPEPLAVADHAVPAVEGTGPAPAARLVVDAQQRPPRPPSRAPPAA
ncbi:hypothetical protein [Phreatobacter sp. AB_2022a]|uniref:hypothetical protein n=1 Tax=Phreatobacter sp. AB_2022a TaxID=3003134 RepID=UPI002286DDD5|nr:hypothetical protein [Phreatobacter sp. AB_2022a]MCZ0732858.1 hypothetical protein [Phreatobacter sp. AB_2022a]